MRKRLLYTLTAIYSTLFLYSLAFNQGGYALGSVVLPPPFMSVSELFTVREQLYNEKADSLIENYVTEFEERGNTGDLSSFEVSTPEPMVSIENGEGGLRAFFSALLQSSKSQVVRISHFGDSQIEGDRLTSNLRTEFQGTFGGTGIGYIPLGDPASHVTIDYYSSKNITKYNVFNHAVPTGRYYGLSGAAFMVRPSYSYSFDDTVHTEVATEEIASPTDTTAPVKKAVQKKTVTEYFTEGKVEITIPPTVQYSKLSLLVQTPVQPVSFSVYDNDKNKSILNTTLTSAVSSEKQGNFVSSIPIPTQSRSLQLTFDVSESQFYYGLLLEGDNGVQIDNYAIRGHSGGGLLKLNEKVIFELNNYLNPSLIIFQFGANTVPYHRTDAQIAILEQQYLDLFMKFKAMFPNTSFLIIGVGDMAKKSDGTLASYPQIPKIRDAQKRAAQKAGFAFWDLYEAMGGKNAILSWSQKGLAFHDGHLSQKGSRVIAREIFNALMKEYGHYLQSMRRVN